MFQYEFVIPSEFSVQIFLSFKYSLKLSDTSPAFNVSISGIGGIRLLCNVTRHSGLPIPRVTEIKKISKENVNFTR